MTKKISLKYFRINKTLKHGQSFQLRLPGLKYFRINKTLKHCSKRHNCSILFEILPN